MDKNHKLFWDLARWAIIALVAIGAAYAKYPSAPSVGAPAVCKCARTMHQGRTEDRIPFAV